MHFRQNLHTVTSQFRLASLLLCIALAPSPLSAASRPSAVIDSGYVLALAAADHFLQAWQASDTENGVALLTVHAKEAVSREALDKFFSDSQSSGYEIGHGRLLRRGRYEFPVALIAVSAKSLRVRRRISTIVIVNTGNNDWAVDKLP